MIASFNPKSSPYIYMQSIYGIRHTWRIRIIFY